MSSTRSRAVAMALMWAGLVGCGAAFSPPLRSDVAGFARPAAATELAISGVGTHAGVWQLEASAAVDRGWELEAGVMGHELPGRPSSSEEAFAMLSAGVRRRAALAVDLDGSVGVFAGGGSGGHAGGAQDSDATGVAAGGGVDAGVGWRALPWLAVFAMTRGQLTRGVIADGRGQRSPWTRWWSLGAGLRADAGGFYFGCGVLLTRWWAAGSDGGEPHGLTAVVGLRL